MTSDKALEVGIDLAETAANGRYPFYVARENAKEAATTLAALRPFVEAAGRAVRLRAALMKSWSSTERSHIADEVAAAAEEMDRAWARTLAPEGGQT